MLNPGGAVLSVGSVCAEDVPQIEISFRGCGEFTMAVNNPPWRCVLLSHGNGQQELPCFFDAENKTVVINIPPVQSLAGKLIFTFPSEQ